MHIITNPTVNVEPSESICIRHQVHLRVGDKAFYLTETVNGIRLRIAEGDYREIEIRPQSKEEIYISLR